MTSHTSTSPPSRSSSLHPHSQSNKRPVSISSTPHFIYCPVAPLPSRRASTYVKIESPPPSPHQQAFGSSQNQYLQQQKPKSQRPNPGQRRFNESRPIQIPMSFLSISGSLEANSPAARSRSSLLQPLYELPKKHTSSSDLSHSTPMTPPSSSFSSSRSVSSSVKRVPSLFIKRPSRNTFAVSIHPAGHHSTPAGLNLDSTHTTHADVDCRCFLTATSHVEDMDMDVNMDVDVDHESRSSGPSPQTPAAVGHTSSLPQVLVSSQSLTFYGNDSNVSFTNNSIHSHSSTSSSSLHRTSFRANRTHKTANHNKDSNKNPNTNNLKEDLSVPARSKTVLKSVAKSMRQVKKRAADILFGSIRQRSKRSKNSKLHDDVEEGSFATKVDVEDRDGDYTTSTLSLASTVTPSSATLPALTDLGHPASFYTSRSFNCPAPAAIAATSGVPHTPWPMSSSSDPFACSANNLTNASTPDFYDFGECTSTLPGNSLQTLAMADAETDYRRRRRRQSESTVSQMTPQEGCSVSSDSPRTRHLYRYFGLDDAESNIDNKNQGEQKTNASARLGALGYREWLLSKNRITSFMSKCRKGKKDKGDSLDAEVLCSDGVGSNQSDTYPDLHDQEKPEHFPVDSDATRSLTSSKQICKVPTRSTNVPFTSSSADPSASSGPPFKAASQLLRSSSCDARQYTNGRRKKEQEAYIPKPFPFRRMSLGPNTFSPPTLSRESTPAPPSVIVSSF